LYQFNIDFLIGVAFSVISSLSLVNFLLSEAFFS